MTPRPSRRHAHFDAQGRLVGYTRSASHLEADQLQADPAWRQAEGAAMGKQAVFGEAEAGDMWHISDVIFELASGEIVAYEFTDDAGTQRYMPASALQRETGSALCFPETARALIAADLSGLGPSLQWDEDAKAGEFVIVEDFPEPD